MRKLNYIKFKELILSYRDISRHNWPTSDEIPADTIFLNTLYRNIYRPDLPLFELEDIKFMAGVY